VAADSVAQEVIKTAEADPETEVGGYAAAHLVMQSLSGNTQNKGPDVMGAAAQLAVRYFHDATAQEAALEVVYNNMKRNEEASWTQEESNAVVALLARHGDRERARDALFAFVFDDRALRASRAASLLKELFYFSCRLPDEIMNERMLSIVKAAGSWVVCRWVHGLKRWIAAQKPACAAWPSTCSRTRSSTGWTT